MGQNGRTAEPPTSSGWYVVLRRQDGEFTAPEVHFCAELERRLMIGCMEARGGTDFTSLSAPYFARALWHGPFATRREAREAAKAA
jgi:hypothetical protein